MDLLHIRIESSDFVPPLNDSDLICSLCSNVLKEPMQTVECGHNFCKECLFPTNSNRPTVCPVDLTPFDESKVFPDKRMERQILNKVVKCPNSPNCTHNGVLSALSEHFKFCLWEVVACPYGCGERFLRREERHIGEGCAKRRVVCQYCSGVFLSAELDGHLKGCPSAPVECPNAGCEHIVRRQDLSHHIKEECAEEVLACPLARSGCEGSCARGLLSKHFEEKSVFHGKMVQQVLTDLKSQLEELSERMQQQQDGHSKLLSDVQKDCEKKIEDLVSTHSKQLNDLKMEYDRKIEEQVKGVQIRCDKKIERLKSTHSKKLNDFKTDYEEKIEKQLNDIKKMEQSFLELKERVNIESLSCWFQETTHKSFKMLWDVNNNEIQKARMTDFITVARTSQLFKTSIVLSFTVLQEGESDICDSVGLFSPNSSVLSDCWITKQFNSFPIPFPVSSLQTIILKVKYETNEVIIEHSGKTETYPWVVPKEGFYFGVAFRKLNWKIKLNYVQLIS